MKTNDTTEDLYCHDGVNVPLGDKFSRFAGKLCQQTYRNCPKLEVIDCSDGLFRGPRFFRPKDMPYGVGFHIAPDGIGTKSIITDAAEFHDLSAHDWVAMCAGDVTRYGGWPVLFSNDLNVSSLGEDEQSDAYRAACNLMQGLKSVSDQNSYVMYNGETAEMGPCVSSENPIATLKYIWAGVAFGFFHPDTVITGERVRPGQVIIALRENGLRSNGGSSVRKALKMRFGEDWYNTPEAWPYIKDAAEPSVIYDPFLAAMNGWPGLEPVVRASLIVHLTGGSFRGKFFEDFLKRHGFSAKLDDLFDPPHIMQLCGEWRGFDSAGFYDTFHGGQGVLVVVEQEDATKFIRHAQKHNIVAKACGKITSRDIHPELWIKSKYKPGDVVVIS